jgi:hypothetical protein
LEENNLLNRIKNYIWLPKSIKKYRGLLMLLVVLWITGCVLLVIPQLRSALISIGEKYILNHSADRVKWQQTLLFSGLAGIIAPLVFLGSITAFVYKYHFFKNEKTTKIVSGIFMGLVSVLVIWLIMYRAAWVFGDDHQFLATTAINKYILLAPDSGRFWPLGLFHYNLLVVFSRLLARQETSAAAHFILNAGIYGATVVFLYFLFRDIEPAENKKNPYINALFVCFLPIFSVAFIMVYMQCVFPETIVTLLFCIFMFCYYRALKTNKTKYYIIALIAAVYSTYCKEPIFGLFAVFALVNFLFGFKKQTKQNILFNTALLINAVVFAVLYYNLSYRIASEFYNVDRVEQNTIQSIILIFVHTKLLLFVLFLFLIRLFFVIIKKDRAHLYYDSLLFAGAAYIAAYIILHLHHRYYFFPAVILSLPSFVYWSKYLFLKKNKFYITIFLLPITLICFFNLGEEIILAKETIIQRKGTMVYVNNLITDYESGKKLLWYEFDGQDWGDESYKTVRSGGAFTFNAFINYVKKTDRDYFVTVTQDDPIEEYLSENNVFFYSRANNHYEPMAADLLEQLQAGGYILESDFFEVYKYHTFPR